LLTVDAANADFVGIDSEWVPDWDNLTNNPVSVLQLAFPRSQRVYVLQLGQLGYLPEAVKMMLSSSSVLKVGFGLKRDRFKFAQSGFEVAVGTLLDLQMPCDKMLGQELGLGLNGGSLSLDRAATSMLGYTMNKDLRITCSNWAVHKLADEQIWYAALDAWVPLRLYGALGLNHVPTGMALQHRDSAIAAAIALQQQQLLQQQQQVAAGTTSTRIAPLTVTPAPLQYERPDHAGEQQKEEQKNSA
jgi:ribonuclease D